MKFHHIPEHHLALEDLQRGSFEGGAVQWELLEFQFCALRDLTSFLEAASDKQDQNVEP